MLNYAILYWGTVGAVFGNTPHIVQVDDFRDRFAFRLIEGPSYISDDAVLWGHCDDNLSRVVLLLLNHYMMMMIMTMMIMDDHE